MNPIEFNNKWFWFFGELNYCEVASNQITLIALAPESNIIKMNHFKFNKKNFIFCAESILETRSADEIANKMNRNKFNDRY